MRWRLKKVNEVPGGKARISGSLIHKIWWRRRPARGSRRGQKEGKSRKTLEAAAKASHLWPRRRTERINKCSRWGEAEPITAAESEPFCSSTRAERTGRRERRGHESRDKQGRSLTDDILYGEQRHTGSTEYPATDRAASAHSLQLNSKSLLQIQCSHSGGLGRLCVHAYLLRLSLVSVDSVRGRGSGRLTEELRRRRRNKDVGMNGRGNCARTQPER